LHRVYYWFGAHFTTSLLVQALLMIGVHLVLLHVALTNRPPMPHLPFQPTSTPRPYNFWQWRSSRPYWTFLSYFTATLLVLHILLSNSSIFIPYTNILGYVALAIEATLPLPQLLSNYKRRGCKGFRVSVIINWIIGDTFKMWFFFASSSGEIPIAFKICGVFQACCDAGLGMQFWVWGDGPDDAGLESGLKMDGVGREKAIMSPLPTENGFLDEKMGFGEGNGIGIQIPGQSWERSRVS
jgi:hypothetical protein